MALDEFNTFVGVERRFPRKSGTGRPMTSEQSKLRTAGAIFAFDTGS